MMKKMKNTRRANITIALIALCVIAIVTMTIPCFAQTSSIPIILDYAGENWINQNGEIMEDGAAEKFLENNPEYAREILRLNDNKNYTTGLQNEIRAKTIDRLYEEYVAKKWRESAINNTRFFSSDRNALMYVAILEEIVANPSTDDALYKLIAHLQNNGARKDVEVLQNGGVTADESAEDMARHIFFGMLAKNYDSKYLDEVCGTTIMGNTSPQIPAILLADQKTWLDQNGNVMDEERAHFFLTTNKEYAQEIAYLNNNPYYLPWREDTHDEEIVDLFWNKFQLSDTSRENPYATRYEWVMRDIKDNPPSTEILSIYQKELALSGNGATRYISGLLDYIEGDSDDFSYGFIPRYVFWNAVAKATENGAFENIGE